MNPQWYAATVNGVTSYIKREGCPKGRGDCVPPLFWDSKTIPGWLYTVPRPQTLVSIWPHSRESGQAQKGFRLLWYLDQSKELVMSSSEKVRLKGTWRLPIFEELSRGRITALALYTFKISKWDQWIECILCREILAECKQYLSDRTI